MGMKMKMKMKLKIRIISSNIRFDNPKDEKNSWQYRKCLLGRILNDHGPDLIGTQEGRRPQLLELGDLLPHHQINDRHREWIQERMYPSIFYNTRTISPLTSGDLWLSQTPYIPGSVSFGSTFPRLATWIMAETKEANRKIFFANLHLDHVLPETRFRQIEIFINEIKKINRDQRPFILSGDFNEGPDGEVRKILLSEFPQLYDPWQHLDHPERSSHHHFNKNQGHQEPGSRIDWILVDKNFEALAIFFDESCEDEIFPSDHFPLVAEISL